ncbi:hypothetical protein GV827_05880 [Sulfitobacter sp. JBTF-M27]|uniref:Uncharacterized protein n=1 Tax=Sulfitobacter sediminilitoris TaxID=2698830 RepID=A0A6P0C9X2_9RHOB|nr:hypothetical protein [Sulfitobacter sediminilitoris]NEK21928.1 hypothetical protein [Sulfitobacter sediminilitoris]
MKLSVVGLRALPFLFVFIFSSIAYAADVDRFAGTYTGNAEFISNDEKQRRDLSTTITPNKDGFTLSWTSVTHRKDGRIKEATYTIEFFPSPREGIYSSAMKVDIFGKRKPLNPLNGEPFVWARFRDDTFSTYSLFITEEGEYEMQEYHRTLTDGGLDLVFHRVRDSMLLREIKAFLAREG